MLPDLAIYRQYGYFQTAFATFFHARDFQFLATFLATFDSLVKAYQQQKTSNEIIAEDGR